MEMAENIGQIKAMLEGLSGEHGRVTMLEKTAGEHAKNIEGLQRAKWYGTGALAGLGGLHFLFKKLGL